ncbi:MAG: tRNA (N(6)-L-threonylcarbamoyladenosine(37)-C(2))-methylthiotransferase MtaB [Lachnospiraceae bacterium]|nr:tRNA (N(6)-L-threonylcarbamoyladenosine(37)-C(2))-methylthiotransferase MtaB [Lachnospiraceae bacterium]
MKKRASLHNLGCKVNAYEMDVMEELLEAAGYEIVPFDEAADVVIINTCSVTNIADRKSRQMLHKARKRNPVAVIAAVGCYVQTGGRDRDADLYIGNNRKGEIVSILSDYLKLGSTPKDSVIDVNAPCPYEDMQLGHISEHTRAYIKIQDGCNQFCSYCIIPYARGRVRSRERSEILKEAGRLARNGCREFVLTGIHISSYGYDLRHPDKKPMANCFEEEELLELLRELDRLDGVERIRLSSLEPRIITADFVKGLTELKSFCPHFHLSLQSGSDSVLKRMNRQYDTEDYAGRVKLLREYFTDPAITTDIIVGFPGETEEEFAQTLAFAERIAFYEMHIFRYSARKGTPAASMKGQLTEAQKAARSDRLEELGARMTKAFIRKWKGKECEVLCEEEKEIDGMRYMTGHTREYLKIAIPESSARPGEVRRVRVGDEMKDGFVHGIE